VAFEEGELSLMTDEEEALKWHQKAAGYGSYALLREC